MHRSLGSVDFLIVTNSRFLFQINAVNFENVFINES